MRSRDDLKHGYSFGTRPRKVVMAMDGELGDLGSDLILLTGWAGTAGVAYPHHPHRRQGDDGL